MCKSRWRHPDNDDRHPIAWVHGAPSELTTLSEEQVSADSMETAELEEHNLMAGRSYIGAVVIALGH